MKKAGYAWKIYKRAYKKYYARLMKGTMSQENFKLWAEQAVADRDWALRQLKNVLDESYKKQINELLRQRLNEK